MSEAWRNLLEQIEPFAAGREFVGAEASQVAARLGQACNEALRDWIGDLHEDNRHSRGGLPDGFEIGRSRGEDRVRLQTDQLRRIGLRERSAARVPANVDAEILPFDPSGLP